MREALELSREGLESVSPNPLVGAVVVRGGRIVGRGFHRRYGGPHAEIEALRAAGSARGADLYVTLEPCGHQGKTPPCAPAIVEAGVRRVAYAAADPNPLTRGRGLRLLRASGVELHHGLLRGPARALNRPFFHWVKTGRPWVILKWAMSLDGKTATARRESRWISGPPARREAHALRRRVDAVLVGTETVLADDPRLVPRPARGRRPWRVVLDRRGRLPLSARLLAPPGSGGEGPRLYVTSPDLSARRRREIQSRGIEVLDAPLAREGPGSLPRLDLEAVLLDLGERGVSQLLVEGGGELAASFIEGGWAHELVVLVAPRLIGGREAPTPLGGRGVLELSGAPSLEDVEVRRVGKDVLIRGRVRGP